LIQNLTNFKVRRSSKTIVTMPSFKERIFSIVCISVVMILLLPRGNRRLKTTQADIDWLLKTATEQNKDIPIKKVDPDPEWKPLMHTFWEPIGETSPGDDAMLDLWKDEWGKLGFTTRIITLADAERHPYFEEMKKVVEEEFPDDVYNQYCFYRYLAMAACEGGWMSDFDTLPTNFPIKDRYYMPNKGGFTSFQSHVPSLISAKAGEWTRIGELLTEAIARTDKWINSDMYVLLTLKEDQENNVTDHKIDFRSPSWNVKAKFQYMSAHEINCRDMAIGRAIHFSHSALAGMYKNGLFPVKAEWPLKDGRRAQAAKIFMDEWRDQCGGSTLSD